MSQIIMYPVVVNSPQTELQQELLIGSTTVVLVDGSVLPDAPNIATIGIGEDAETIYYPEKDVNILSNVTRGFQGDAKAWHQGTPVARLITEYDYAQIKNNIEEHIRGIENALHQTLSVDPEEDNGKILQLLASYMGDTWVQSIVFAELSTTDIKSGVFDVKRGGTGIGSYTQGDFIRAQDSTTLEQRSPQQVVHDLGIPDLLYLSKEKFEENLEDPDWLEKFLNSPFGLGSTLNNYFTDYYWNQIIGVNTALNYVLESESILNVIFDISELRDIFKNNSISWNKILDSNMPVTKFTAAVLDEDISNFNIFADIAGSVTTMTSLSESSSAMDVVKGSIAAVMSISVNPTALKIFLKGTHILSKFWNQMISQYFWASGQPVIPYTYEYGGVTRLIENTADLQNIGRGSLGSSGWTDGLDVDGNPTTKYDDWLLTDHYSLVSNIDWNNHHSEFFIPIGHNPDSAFVGFGGIFNGNGKKILNLKINMSNTDQVGLFRRTTASSHIDNLGLENVNITGRHMVGGLVGQQQGGMILHSYTTGNITGETKVGGFTGVISGFNSFPNTCNIFDCYSEATVNGISTQEEIGGFVGYSQWHSKVYRCYSTGSVSGNSLVGGFCGNAEFSFSKFYNPVDFRGCYWDIQTSGNSTSAQGEPKDTTAMKHISTYTQGSDNQVWDIARIENHTDETWFIGTAPTYQAGDDYPRLGWELVSLPIAMGSQFGTVLGVAVSGYSLGGAGLSIYQPNRSYSGSYDWRINIDLTDITQLKIKTKHDRYSSSQYIEIIINNNTVFSNNHIHDWTERVIDVSSYTGECTLTLRKRSTIQTSNEAYHHTCQWCDIILV